MTIYISTRRCNLTDLLNYIFNTDEVFRAYGPSRAQLQIFEENEKIHLDLGFDNEEVFETKILGWTISLKPDKYDHECVYELKVSRQPDNRPLELRAYVQAGVGAKALGKPYFETWIYYQVLDTSSEQPSQLTWIEKKRYRTADEWSKIEQILKKGIEIFECARSTKNYVKSLAKIEEEVARLE